MTGQFVFAHVEKAKQYLSGKQYEKALHELKLTETYPENLGEGKLINAEENDVYYWMGCAYEGMGDTQEARRCFEHATKGSAEPAIAFFYNDQQPDKIFYQGLAWRKLGNEAKARSCFHRLISHGEKHYFDQVKIDYFAVSLPDLLIWDDDLTLRNRIHCLLVEGLGHLGLGNRGKGATAVAGGSKS